MRKKLLLLLVSCLTAVYGWAQSGTCGPNLTWNFDSSTGTLTISGEGEMTNYESNSWYGDITPWNQLSVNNVIIEEGVTSIGSCAFYYCEGLTSVTIGNSVTSIGGSAFYRCTSLTSITIPNGVTNIGNYAFSGCNGLEDIYVSWANPPSIYSDVFKSITLQNLKLHIPNGTLFAYINASIWSYCELVVEGIEMIDYGTCGANNNNLIWQLTNDNILTISGTGEMDVFYSSGGPWRNYHTQIKQIMIEESVTSIGDFAFSGCSNLTFVTIPNSVTSIGKRTFSGCNGLTSITIPNGVTNIGDYVFSDCSSLTSIDVLSNNPNYSSQNGVLFNKSKIELILFPIGKSGNYTIPTSVITIGYGAFDGCNSLKSIAISSNVTSIKDYAFYTCNSLTTIQSEAIIAPTLGGSNVFNTSSPLLERTLYLAPNAIGYESDKGWPSNQVRIISEENELIYSVLDLEAKTAKVKAKEGFNVTSLSIPSTVTYESDRYTVTCIEENAFSNCGNLTSVTIPNSITSIGSRAFSYTGLTEITIPENVEYIGSYIGGEDSYLLATVYFNAKNCNKNAIVEGTLFNRNLNTVVFGKNVEHIPANAFKNCISLSSISIPESVTSIGRDAFVTCDGLTSIIGGDNLISIGSGAFSSTQWFANQSYGGGVYIGKVLYYWKTEGEFIPENTVLNIKEGTLGIADGAFRIEYGGYLVGITFPNSLKHIGAEAFRQSGLTSVTLPESVTSIGNSAFYDCYSLTTIRSEATVAPILGTNVFYNSTLIERTLYLKANATGYDANKGWPSDQVRFLQEENGLVYSIFNAEEKTVQVRANDSFNASDLSALKQTISYEGETYTLTAIEDNAFSGCNSLTSVTIPESISHIGASAFRPCSNLTSVNFNAINCTAMGTEDEPIFQGCRSLTKIHIGNQVQIIPDYAFGYCGVTSVVIPNSVTSIGNDAFIDCPGLASVIIGNNVTNIGEYAFSETAFSEITIPNSVTNIGVGAFSECTKLTSIVIPPSVTSIGDDVFYGCSSLVSITIPAGVTSIGRNAFYGCKPSEVSIPDLSSGYTALLTSSLQKLTLNNIESIGASNSLPASLVELSLSNTLTSMANGALSKLQSLQTLTLPFIGTSPTTPTTLNTLFRANGAPATLKKLTIVRSSNDIQIANEALSGCASLTELTLSSNVKGLGTNALYGCNGLTDIYSHWAYPPTAYNTSSFQGVNKFVCKLHIPVGSKQYYSVADGWKEFYNIEEEAAVTITVQSVPVYGGVIGGALQYNYDDNARLTATGNMGYDFQCWMENNQVVSTDREYIFTVESPRTLYAVFTPKENADENILIQAQGNSATISWIAVEDAANYALIVYSDENRTAEIARFQLDVAGNILRAATGNLSCTIPELNLETTYYYSLTSYDADSHELTISNGNFSTTDGTGVEQILSENQLRIYPNPVQESFRVDGITESSILTISDITAHP